jgi:CDGSH iron-sulfur domain-containing protein 2
LLIIKFHHLFTVKDWLALIPPTAATAGFVYVTYLAFCPVASCPGRKVNKKINNKVRLNEAKVVDMIDIEDISEKAAFCRCWKSKNWPYW